MKLTDNQVRVLRLVRDGRPFMGTAGSHQSAGRASTLLSLIRAGLVSVEEGQGYLLTARGITYLSANHQPYVSSAP